MAESLLLKFARARDDADFRWRIAAAMMLKAQEIVGKEISPESASLTEWVLNNPMVPHDRMIAFVATNPNIGAAISLVHGAVDTSPVPDGDIQFVVGHYWDKVAAQLFPQKNSASK